MKRLFACLLTLILLCVSMGEAYAVINTKSPKYAALVMDADTGEVLFSRSADEKRYPASLTKMMTLYLLFEALNKGTVKMDTAMKVSKRAASQPQTNISLREGQTVPVRDAIKALIVRSANDVAVVVAEHLGKTESAFAQMMTTKARSLGMRSTNYRNPHGLPDVKQYTTARDIAKLSVALRRDFPQFYSYFKSPSFYWKGTTYTSHNRVIGRFEGADGIKTGFINMSGFNVATSVDRDGYHIVSVVLGGQTGADRDDHMVSLLEKTFTVLAERADQPRRFAQAPIPVARPERVVSVSEPAPVVKPEIAVATIAPEQPVELTIGQTNIQPVDKPVIQEASVPAITQAHATPNTLQYQLTSLKSPTSSAQMSWGIQVGAFADERSALNAAANAIKLARSSLQYSKVSVTDKGSATKSIHRARLANLSEYQAKQACQRLQANNAPCFVFCADL